MLNIRRQGHRDHEVAGHLEKRVNTVDLYTLYNSITGANKVNTGAAKGWTLNPTTAAAFTTSIFYGCTIAITVDGRGVIIGHFAEVRVLE